MRKQTIVDEIADRLALRIASGVHAPGELMPSIRRIADEFGVNRATAQLILGRLEAAGFVSARRGLGFTVRDVRLYGGLDTHRHLFRFARDLPDTAAGIFQDVVELHQDLFLRTVRTIAADPRRYDPAAARRAAARLELLAATDDPDLAELFEAELNVLRAVVAAVGQTAHLAVLNSLAETLAEVPEAVEAFFAAEPRTHAAAWLAMLRAWEANEPPTEPELALFGDLAALHHRRAVERFRRLVGAASDLTRHAGTA